MRKHTVGIRSVGRRFFCICLTLSWNTPQQTSPPSPFQTRSRCRTATSATTASCPAYCHPLSISALQVPARHFFSGAVSRWSSFFSSRRTSSGRKQMLAEAFTSELSGGLGSGGELDGGRTLSNQMEKAAASRTREDLRLSPPGSTLPPDALRDLMDLGEATTSRTSRLGRPLPLAYDLEVRRVAQRKAAQHKVDREEFHEAFDALNMPCGADKNSPTRKRASWEMKITPEHRSLVLLLYRQILKSLIHFKSIRRRSLIAYARLTFRRRASATEKLLIDECVEEARRAMYVLGKHHAFTESRQYEYDSMTMPKDTGQDVKTYMEEVYDPEVSRQQFQHFSDVQPGKEHLHSQKLGPASGKHHFGNSSSGGGNGGFKTEIREEDKVLRPPPPPGIRDD